MHSDISQPGASRRSCILVVSRNGHMGEFLIEQVLLVAERLGASILALHINTLPYFPDGGRRARLFTAAMEESRALFIDRAEPRSIPVQVHQATGQVGDAVRQFCHNHRPIDFIIVDQGLTIDKVARVSPVPVYAVTATAATTGRPARTTATDSFYSKGAITMSTTSKSRHLRNCLVFGAMTAAVYAAVFTNQETIMHYFGKGGVYCLLPVALVFAVSYAHGNFTSAFWSALGIERSQAEQKPVAVTGKEIGVAPVVRKDSRPRAQVRA